MRIKAAFWRRWHRWIAFPFTLFLFWASVTGCVVGATEFFGEAEHIREATRDLVSPVTLEGPLDTWQARLSQAFAAAADSAGDAPVDKVTVFFKGDEPTVTVFTGKPEGGEDRKFVVDANSGRLVKVEDYADKPFINRLHSGEAFGDGGLFFSMFWGLSLAVLTVSGLLIYLTMWKPGRQGLRRIFW